MKSRREGDQQHHGGVAPDRGWLQGEAHGRPSGRSRQKRLAARRAEPATGASPSETFAPASRSGSIGGSIIIIGGAAAVADSSGRAVSRTSGNSDVVRSIVSLTDRVVSATTAVRAWSTEA